MESEIKNTVYIGIGCSLLALILSFVMIMGYIRNTMATARNEEIMGKQQVSNYNEFYTYQDGALNGMQLVRLITESNSKGLEVYVTGISDTSKAAELNSIDGTDSSSQYYNSKLFISNPEVYKVIVDQETGDITGSPLVNLYADTDDKASRSVYKTYLVYNNGNVKTATPVDYTGNAEVTGVHVTYSP